MSVSKTIRKFIPPILLDAWRAFQKKAISQPLWKGSYENWQTAMAQTKGYNDTLILERVKDSLLKVKNGEAVYERDSVLFDKIQYAWPLLACLENVALKDKGRLHLVDFGGSLGSSYYQ